MTPQPAEEGKKQFAFRRATDEEIANSQPPEGEWRETIVRQFFDKFGSVSQTGQSGDINMRIGDFLMEALSTAIATERGRIIKLLDWRKRTDGVQFHDGDDVVDWIDEKIKALTPTNTDTTV